MQLSTSLRSVLVLRWHSFLPLVLVVRLGGSQDSRGNHHQCFSVTDDRLARLRGCSGWRAHPVRPPPAAVRSPPLPRSVKMHPSGGTRGAVGPGARRWRSVLRVSWWDLAAGIHHKELGKRLLHPASNPPPGASKNLSVLFPNERMRQRSRTRLPHDIFTIYARRCGLGPIE